MGILSDGEICKYILLKIHFEDKEDIIENHLLKHLQASIIEANECLTQEDAFNYIKSQIMFTPINMDKETGEQKKKEFTEDVLNNDLFPHCSTKIQKNYYLGYILQCLLRAAYGYTQQDDRDSYLNKRIDLTGTLLNNLFRNYFNKLVKDMQKSIIKEINTGSWRSTYDYMNIVNHTNIYKIIKSTTIENGIKRALSTGDFGIKQSNSSKVGVAQVLNTLTSASILSHSRRISTPIDKSGKLVPPRMLHNTTWGYLCPAETPEGPSVGVVKNLSYMAHITIPSQSHNLYHYVEDYLIPLDETKPPAFYYNKVKLFVNGCFLGVTNEPQKAYLYLKDLKYKGMINIYTSVVFNYSKMEIRICNDAGRLTRPLMRVVKNNLLMTQRHILMLRKGELKWDDLLCNLKIQFSG